VGPVQGKFVDADTGEPIGGGVAYAIWLEILPNPVHAQKAFYDVKFAVTDDGRSRPSLLPTRIEPPLFDYVAPWYQIVTITRTNPSTPGDPNAQLEPYRSARAPGEKRCRQLQLHP
jgi:hypothetical protein